MHSPRKSSISASNPNKQKITICLIGDGGIGAKSSLLSRFLFDSFTEVYDPTIEDRISAEIEIDGKKEKIEFVDTSGQEEYFLMRKETLTSISAFIVGFDLTNVNSFLALPFFLKEIKKATGRKLKKIPLILVGNKVDLEKKRQVLASEAIKLSVALSCPYVETSAKTGHNVQYVFQQIIRKVRARREENMTSKFKTLVRNSPSLNPNSRNRSRTIDIIRREDNLDLTQLSEANPLGAFSNNRQTWEKKQSPKCLTANDINFCSQCGSLLHQGGRFCGICGFNNSNLPIQS